jgi:hypothetical protein
VEEVGLDLILRWFGWSLAVIPLGRSLSRRRRRRSSSGINRRRSSSSSKAGRTRGRGSLPTAQVLGRSSSSSSRRRRRLGSRLPWCLLCLQFLVLFRSWCRSSLFKNGVVVRRIRTALSGLLGKHTGDDNDDAFDQSTRKHFDSMQECTAKGLSVSMGIVGGMSLAISVRNILTEARLLLSDAQVVCVLIMGSIAVIQQVLPTVLSSKMLGVLCVVMILNTSIFVATAHR